MIFSLVRKIKVERMLKYSKEEMYEIVRDIAKYKDFIPGIKESKILTACERNGIKAELVFGVKGIESRFVSLVVLDPHHTISATSYSNDVMGNLGFKSLSSKWEFQNGIGGKGTLVKLEINLEFNNFIMGKVTGMMVDEKVGLILNAFENRAKKLYSNTQTIKGSIRKD